MIASDFVRSFVVCCLFFLALPAGAAAAAPVRPAAPTDSDGPAVAFPRGEIVDPVVCAGDPEQSYALYLPSGYAPDRFWPVLLVLDARGRGRLGAELFRDGAERWGWIVASSNDSRSDAGWEPMRRAAAALYDDLPRRLAVDPRRQHFAGFSGTARGAAALAATVGAAGVIGAGGGLPDGLEVSAELPFAHFGSAGVEDFNYQEMQALDRELTAAGVPHRLAVHPGPHSWPPPEVATEAIGWLELVAMRRGLRPVDEPAARELVAGWRQRAEAREAAGDLFAAWRGWQDLAADLAGLAGFADAAAAAVAERERLAAAPEVVAARAERARLAAWEAGQRRDIEEIFGALIRFERLPPPSTRVRGERMIRQLQGLAGGEGPEAEAARRVLALIGVHTSFYMPRQLLARGEHARAALALELATRLRDDNPRVWYNLACARARLGQSKKALDALERAVTEGFADRDRLSRDPDLESLHDEPRFRALAAPPVNAP